MDYRFAAGDIGDFSAVCGVPFQTIADLPACPRCLAGQIIGQKNRLITQRPGSFHGRTAQLTHTSDDAAMPVRDLFRRFCLQTDRHLRRDQQPEFLCQFHCLCAGRGVGNRWAGGNHIDLVA